MSDKPIDAVEEQSAPLPRLTSGTAFASGRHPHAATGAASVELGLRERNKAQKLQRIRTAARRQFAEKGYDETTLREIAKEAGVALGTLAFYADNKRDLVLLIFNEAMPRIVSSADQHLETEMPVLDAVVEYFRPFYEAYARELTLYRILLRENVFSESSVHAREFQRLRQDTISRLHGLLDKARQRGEIRAYIDVDLAARTLFMMFFAAVRWWLWLNEPRAQDGLAEYRGMVALLIDGMK